MYYYRGRPHPGDERFFFGAPFLGGLFGGLLGGAVGSALFARPFPVPYPYPAFPPYPPYGAGFAPGPGFGPYGYGQPFY